jgi:hypothetical protein
VVISGPVPVATPSRSATLSGRNHVAVAFVGSWVVWRGNAALAPVLVALVSGAVVCLCISHLAGSVERSGCLPVILSRLITGACRRVGSGSNYQAGSCNNGRVLVVW